MTSHALTEGAAVVFQCAQPEYTEWPEKFPPIVEGIIAGVARSGAKLIVGDNLYMYGPTGGAPISEDLPYAATGRKGRTRAEMAQRLLDAHNSGKVRVAIGRASDFYGPRVEGSAVGDMVFAAALQGKTVNALGDVRLPHTYTYISDFGDALVTLAEHDEALGQAWHVPNAPTGSTQEFVDMVGQAVGRPVKISNGRPRHVDSAGSVCPRNARDERDVCTSSLSRMWSMTASSARRSVDRPRRWSKASPRPLTGTAAG